MAGLLHVELIDWESRIETVASEYSKIETRRPYLHIGYALALLGLPVLAAVPVVDTLFLGTSAPSLARAGAAIIAVTSLMTIFHLLRVYRAKARAELLEKPELSMWGPEGSHVQKNPNRTVLDSDLVLESRRQNTMTVANKCYASIVEQTLTWEAASIAWGTLLWGFGDLAQGVVS